MFTERFPALPVSLAMLSLLTLLLLSAGSPASVQASLPPGHAAVSSGSPLYGVEANVAQTSICGTISDYHWTVAGSPYVITCNANFSSGTLLIDPGVVVSFEPNTKLDISGTLSAEGTQDQLIIFTSNRPAPARGDWAGLFLHSGSSSSVLRHVVVEYGKGISVDNSSPLIDYATIRYNASSGVYLNRTASTVSHSTIISNTAQSGAGIHISYGTATVDSNTISWNSATTRGGGIHGYGYSGGATITVTNNTIDHNTVGSYGGAGIIFDSANGLIADNMINDNTLSSGYGGGVNISGASRPSVIVRNNIVVRNTVVTGGCGGVNTDAFTTLTGNLIGWNRGTNGGVCYYGPSSISITCNTIVENGGLGVATGVVGPLHRNAIYGNTGFQLYNDQSRNIDATDNYWGQTDPSLIAAGIYDHSDNSGLGIVSFSPYLSTSDPCAPSPIGWGAYAISGRVTGESGQALAGVMVSAGAAGSASTDASGAYTISGLAMGTYTLTPNKSDYTFSPERVILDLSADLTDVNFIGVSGGSPQGPFLDLPFSYDDTMLSFVRALRDTEVGGRVSSWFDHQFPIYGTNNQMLPYDGITRTVLTNFTFGCYNRICYDGHDGIDLTSASGRSTTTPTPILAAASGTVVAVEPNCNANCCDGGCASGCELGKYVLVSHQNGYFTRYAHLDVITPTVGMPVAAGTALGNMGNTGHSCGTHLHFAVYRGDPRTTSYRQVDPFGWLGAKDPWVTSQTFKGPVSSRLWLHNPGAELMCQRDTACDVANPAGDIVGRIAPGFFAGPARLELSSGLVAQPSAQLRSTGHSFWLRLLEGAVGGGSWQALRALGSKELTSSAPITLTVAYSDTEILHLDRGALSLRQWDEALSAWQPLTTTVSSTSNVITATATSLGNFDLQASLLCPADAVEPDDSYFTAHDVITGTTVIQRLFDVATDEDWFRLEAVTGKRVTLDTAQLTLGVDTILELYDIDGLTLMAADDNGGRDKASHLEWRFAQDGVYFVRVASAPGGAVGCDATYQLSLYEIRQVYLPMVLR